LYEPEIQTVHLIEIAEDQVRAQNCLSIFRVEPGRPG
jgi:hypothetical protein